MAARAATVWLKRGKERSLLRRHPWIYASGVARVDGDPDKGALVAVRAEDGRFLAWGSYSPGSLIRVRCWTYDEAQRVDEGWIGERARAAVERRTPLQARSNALRLVFGEADELPGLVVDRYDEILVVQIHAAGVDAWRELLIDALCRCTGCSRVFDRSDTALREREGLAPSGGALRGAPPADRVQVREHGLDFNVDLRRGHKTGFYIDQRDNRRLAGEWVRDFARQRGRSPRVLNCFCYTGAFSIAAARAGAAAVLSIDSSAEALALAGENAQLNGLGAQPSLRWRCADVFDEMRALREQGERFELIILDPPKFATNTHQVERATRAYKDINLSALRLLEPGGALMSFSCSSAIDVDLFQKVVAGAVIDAGAQCYLRARLAAGSDHPVLMTHPEGEYLKGLLLERA